MTPRPKEHDKSGFTNRSNKERKAWWSSVFKSDGGVCIQGLLYGYDDTMIDEAARKNHFRRVRKSKGAVHFRKIEATQITL